MKNKNKNNRIKEKNNKKKNKTKLVDYISENDLSWLAGHIVCDIGTGKDKYN